MAGQRSNSDTMIQFGAAMVSVGTRLARFPLVLLLAIGLLVSLIHCSGCDPGVASTDAAAVATNLDRSSVPDVPEQGLPCHSGHCLSHATAQQMAAVLTPADFAPRALSFGREQFPAAHAGLPLFKPPRA